MKTSPKISLITCCYNSSTTIEDTINSVLQQDYKNYEHIIIDGASKDNTLEIIEKYREQYQGRLTVVSEKDKGIYDAFNKGIDMASGDIIGIINSDDIIANPRVLSQVVEAFNNNYSVVYGDLEMLDETLEKVIRKFYGKTGNIKRGWHPPHPTLYLKKEVYERYGKFDISFRIAADYDFMIRILKDNKLECCYINSVLVKMRMGGVSTNGIKGYYKNFLEAQKALVKNQIKYPFIVNSIKTFKALLQHFIK